MGRSVVVGELRTGRRITTIPVSGGSWSQMIGPGDVIVQIPVDADDFAALERDLEGTFPSSSLYGPFYTAEPTPTWRPGMGLRPEFLSAIDPARCFLAVLEDDQVLEAGPIWTWTRPKGSTTLTVAALGLGSIFDYRYVMGLLADWPDGNPAAWEATYSGLSLATIAKRLVQLALSHTGGELPIVLPEDETAEDDADHTRTYYGYDLGALSTRLEQLAGVIGGPEIHFEPRLTEDRLGIEWVMRTGTEADPLIHQHADDWTFDAQVPRGALSGIGVRRDARGMGQRSWVGGAGMEAAQVLALAEDPELLDRGFPLMEQAASRGSVEEAATAERWAVGNLARQLRPWSTWEFDVLARPRTEDGQPAGPQLGQYRPGDFARVWVPSTDLLLANLVPADRHHRVRLMRIDGTLAGTHVSVTTAPEMEAR